MNPDFRLHYDRLRENDSTKPENRANEAGAFYDMPNHARNLCLIWLDGKRQFLSYAYLVGGTFTPGEEMNEIVLNFSAYTVTLKGYGLELVFAALLDQTPRQIMQAEQRYIGSDAAGTVQEIVVEPIK